jgi:putative inorganic carbon (HCO3(-)) transporter
MTFFLTLIFMILVFWRPQDWLFPWLYGWPLLDIITIFSLVSLLMEGQAKQIRFPRSVLIPLAFGLWVASIVSHVPHTYFQGMLDTLPETFKLCFFMVLLLVVMNTPSRLRIVLGVIVAMSCFMALHGVLQQRNGVGFGGLEPMMVFTPEKGWYSRSLFFGIFSDPNDMAQMLAAAIPLVFAVPRRLSAAPLGLGVLVAGFLYYAIQTTHSRGGMISLLTVGGLMVLMLFPVRALPYFAVLGLIAFLALCGTGSLFSLDESARGRVVFWGEANRAFKSNPVFGVGYGMFWQVSGGRAAHNAFVGCYTEIGAFGYWFWFSLLQTGFVGCWRARMSLRGRVTGEDAYLRRAAGLAIASLGGFAAGAYFLSRAFVFPLFFLLAIVHAISVLVPDRLPKGSPPLLIWGRDVLGMGTVATLASIFYIYFSILLLNR